MSESRVAYHHVEAENKKLLSLLCIADAVETNITPLV